MSELLISLSDLLVAAWSLLRAVSGLLLPWFPLAVWIGFWLCAVNWVKRARCWSPKVACWACC